MTYIHSSLCDPLHPSVKEDTRVVNESDVVSYKVYWEEKGGVKGGKYNGLKSNSRKLWEQKTDKIKEERTK